MQITFFHPSSPPEELSYITFQEEEHATSHTTCRQIKYSTLTGTTHLGNPESMTYQHDFHIEFQHGSLVSNEIRETHCK